jgi:PKD repeat protein
MNRYLARVVFFLFALSLVAVCGCKDAKDKEVHFGIIVADFSAAPLEGTAPLNAAFTNLSTGRYSSCCWDFGDGTGSSIQTNPVHSYSDSGVYTVTLTLYGDTVTSKTRTDYIVVYETGPSADFTATPTSGPGPLEVAFTDTSVGNITTWYWSFGDGYTSTEQNPVHTYNTGGTYYDVLLTVSGPDGIDTELKLDYITVGTPPPKAEFTADRQGGSSPVTVKFTDMSTGDITEWLWEFGDGETSVEQNPTHVYSGPDGSKFTVSLTVSGPGGNDTETKIDYIFIFYWPPHAEKPVIYLYRDKPAWENVSVIFSGCATKTIPEISVIFSGCATKTIPEIPLGSEITWSNLYLEDGLIYYEGTPYKYLFYECELYVPLLSDKGWVLQRDGEGRIYLDYVEIGYEELRSFFGDELRKAGLFEHEVADFLDYWLDDSQKIFFGKKEFTFAVKYIPPYQLDETMKIVTKNSYDSIVRVQFFIELVRPGTRLSKPVYPAPKRGTSIMHEWGVIPDGRLFRTSPK